MEPQILEKPHVICLPCPLQGHINPMHKLAKLLHSNGVYITFVHTEFNYQRLLNSRALDSVKGLLDFRLETLPDGLPATNKRGILDLPALALSMSKNWVAPLHNLITKLNGSTDVPPVTCIISDGVLSFTLDVAEELDILELVFFTPSACGFLGYLHYEELVERGYVPLKDEDCLTNGYLDTTIDWISGMRGIRLKDLPTFLRTTDRNDLMFNYNSEQVQKAQRANAGLILNTFDELEQEVLDAIRSRFPQVFTIGPLSMLNQQMISSTKLKSMKTNLWREETGCIEWLDNKEAKSVLYVNFGSLAIMTPKQLNEFAWGLAYSKYAFLWVIRTDLVNGGLEILSEDFMEETRGRGLLSGWCPQEQVMSHSSIGGFLTHCGWNSTLESICEGIPMICWPFFAEQQTNCLYIRKVWGIGMEIDNDVKREEVEVLVKELMEGEKGKELRQKAMEWKRKAIEATCHGGSSEMNLDGLVKMLKQPK